MISSPMRSIPVLPVLGLMLCNTAALAQQPRLPALTPYPLPLKAATAIRALAARSDVLVVGEVHGTQQVPEMTAALLPELDSLGYRALALEVPADQQPSIAKWAAGGASPVPAFYDGPHDDGRGNVQMLALIRAALSAPYHWKLICFDTASSRPGDTWQMRDAGMAKNFAAQWNETPSGTKVLAVCGNLHARTANRASPGGSLAGLWPSFAADLQQTSQGKRVRSLNVVPLRGGFFNGGRVNTLHGRGSADAETRPSYDWDLELSLPTSTPATFLETGRPNVATPSLEGLPIQAINITGNVLVPTYEILSVIRSTPGHAFSSETLRADLNAVYRLYKFSKVGPFDVQKTARGGVIITLPVVENLSPG